MNERVEGATKSLADMEAYVATERASLKAYVKKTKDDLTKQKADAEAEFKAAKDKIADSGTAYQSLKTKAIAIEAERAAMKGEIEAIADAIARIDKKATAALREKREAWQAISDARACKFDHDRFRSLLM